MAGGNGADRLDSIVDLSLVKLTGDLSRLARDIRVTAALHGHSNRAIRTARILDDLRDRLGDMDGAPVTR